jgi:cytochrome b subunit of formate dehydrogenase
MVIPLVDAFIRGWPDDAVAHPWFSLAFVIAFTFQFFNWIALMRWTDSDSRWMRRIKGYVTNREPREPADTGFFNGGQKLYFWTIVASALMFWLLAYCSGSITWFRVG